MQNTLKKLSLAGLALAGTIISVGASSPASALSYNNWWYVQRFNNAGVSSVNMIGANAGFCYLAQVKHEETDYSGESAQCTLWRGATNWVLAAQLGMNSDADVDCQAICMNY